MSSPQTHFLLLSNRRARPFFILYLKTVNNTALTAPFTFLSVFPASPIAISSTSYLSAAGFPFYVSQTLGLAILSFVWDRDSVSQPWGGWVAPLLEGTVLSVLLGVACPRHPWTGEMVGGWEPASFTSNSGGCAPKQN